MAEIDSLDIKIQADAKKAEDELVNLAKKLGNVALALTGITNKSGGLKDAASGLSEVAKAVNSIDGNNLTSVSKSVQSLSRGFATLNKSITSITNANAGFSKAASQEADHLAKQWGITDAKAIQKMAEQLDALYNTKGADAPFKELSATIQENAKFANDANTVYSELLSTIQRINSSGNKVSLGFNPSEFINQYSSMRSTLGKAFTSEVGGIDFESWVSEVNGELGNVIPVGNTAVETFQNLVNVIAESRSTMLSFAEYAKQGGVSIEDLEYSIANAHSGMMTYEKTLGTLGQETVDDTQNFEKLATSLRQFEGIEIPDTSNIANLAANIGKLGSKYVTQAATNLQTLAPAMNTFVSEMNKVESLTFNAESLSGLISSISQLGGAKATSAANNIPFIADGLKQLVTEMNQLQRLSFDASSLTELVSSISKLGGKNVENAVTNIPQITTALMQFFQEMQNAPQVSQNTVDMTNALANLATATRGVGSTSSSSMNPFFNSIIKLGNKASDVIKNLANSFLKLQVNIAKTIASKTLIGSFFNKITSGSNKASKGIQSLAYYFGKFYASFFLLRRAFSVLQEAIGYSSDLTEVQNIVDNVFGDAKEQVEDFSNNSIKYFGMSILTAKSVASEFQAMGNAMGITSAQVKASNATWAETETALSGTAMAYDNAADSVADMSLNLTKLAADMGSFYNKDYEDVAENLASGIYSGQTRVLRQYGLDLTEATLKEFALANGLDSDISSMTNAQKTMLRYQYVMSRTENIQSDFLRTSTSWANISRVLTQNLQNLGSTIGDISIHAFKPFLIALNNGILKLNQFAKAVANSLGKIFGWTYEESGGVSDVTDETDDLTDSLDNATDSAKALKNNLLGIDELNILSDTSSTSGSGDSDTSGVASASEGTWKKTESMFANYESELDTLQKLGEYVATSISNSLNSIDWDAIYAKASGFGTGLADFMIGLFSEDENGVNVFGSLGTAIAGSINTAITAVKSWTDEFKKGEGWQKLGDGIADMVSNAINGVKWKDMKDIAANLGTGIADAIDAFVTSDSDPIVAIAKAAANLVDTGITFWYNYVTEMTKADTWAKLGTKIGKGINEFFKSLNEKDEDGKSGWQKLGESFSKNIKGIVKAVTTAIKTVDFEAVGQAIADLIGGIDFEGVSWELGNLANSLANAVYTLVSKKDTWKELGEKIGKGIKKFFKSMGKIDADTGLTGWQALGKSLSGFINGIVTAFVAAVKEIDWSEVGKALGQSLSSFFKNDDGTINISSVNVVLGAIAWKITTTGIAKTITKDLLTTALQNKFTGFGNLAVKLGGLGLVFSGIESDIEGFESDNIKDVVLGSIKESIGATLVSGNWTIGLGTFVLTYGIKALIWDEEQGIGSPIDEFIDTIELWWNDEGNPLKDIYDLFFGDKKLGGSGSVGLEVEKDSNTTAGVASVLSPTTIDVTGNITNTTISEDLETPDIVSTADLTRTNDNISKNEKETKLNDFTVTLNKVNDGISSDDKKNKFKYFTANFSKLYDGLTSTQKSESFKKFTANFNKLHDGISSEDKKTGIGGITAGLKYISDEISSDDKKISGFTAVFTSTSGLPSSGNATSTKPVVKNANGGIFSAGTWHNIPKYAAGTPNAGSVFIAGEAGAEAVAHINGKTEVLNQSQLASAIASAVVSANTQQNIYLQEQNSLLRTQNNYLSQIASKEIKIGDREIARANQRGQRSMGLQLRTT
jgi:hypothetical protein